MSEITIAGLCVYFIIGSVMATVAYQHEEGSESWKQLSAFITGLTWPIFTILLITNSFKFLFEQKTTT